MYTSAPADSASSLGISNNYGINSSELEVGRVMTHFSSALEFNTAQSFVKSKVGFISLHETAYLNQGSNHASLAV